jgi:hypothetical protein
MSLKAKNCCTDKALWDGALSYCKIHLSFHNPSRFLFTPPQRFSQNFNTMVLIDSLATGKPICLHIIPDVEQKISMSLNFELVVQPLFAFGEFGDLHALVVLLFLGHT